MIATLPRRRGGRPRTTTEFPHSQIDQQPEDGQLLAALLERAVHLDGVVERPSLVSVPGARALALVDGVSTGPAAAFLQGREFAHVHPGPDWSLHLALPNPVADVAIDRGWAELHLIARTEALPGSVVMAYAPRDAEEAEVAWTLLQSSYAYARAVEPPTGG